MFAKVVAKVLLSSSLGLLGGYQGISRLLLGCLRLVTRVLLSGYQDVLGGFQGVAGGLLGLYGWFLECCLVVC